MSPIGSSKLDTAVIVGGAAESGRRMAANVWGGAGSPSRRVENSSSVGRMFGGVVTKVGAMLFFGRL